jgi:hypothetical protein
LTSRGPATEIASVSGWSDVHWRPETSTVWQGHDWGHRRIRAIFY